MHSSIAAPSVSRQSTLSDNVLPRTDYGPFVLVDAAPWLLLATVLRIASFSKPSIAVISFPLSQCCVMLAILLATRRMIELSGGTTDLGKLEFREQVSFVGTVFKWLLLIGLFVTITLSQVIGGRPAVAAIVPGLDGVAFDLRSDLGRLWSPVVATLVFFAAMAKADGQRPTLGAVCNAIYPHIAAVIGAIIVMIGFLFLMAPLQAVCRKLLIDIWSLPLPFDYKKWLFIGFVFCFACVRLWAMLAILTWAFKASSRRLVGQQRSNK